jgi:dihydroorotate dehydrogenase electron transfer subunit
MYDEYFIEEVREENPFVRTLFFDEKFDAEPGQFVMLWLQGVDEKPFSVCYENGLTVRRVGEFTTKTFELKKGDKVRIKGPFGTPFPSISRPLTIIGGGTGIMPLRFLAEKNPNSEILVGGKTKEDVLFREELKRYGTLSVSTEDGSLGYKGFVTDLIKRKQNNWYAICGPERMIKVAAEKINDPENIYVSLERYMKCGIGVCGSCSMSGYRVCTDGPVFQYSVIKDAEHFGLKKRVKSGRLVDL